MAWCIAAGWRPSRIISAMSGVTDALISLVKQAAARDAKWPDALAALEKTASTMAGIAAMKP